MKWNKKKYKEKKLEKEIKKLKSKTLQQKIN